MSNFNNHQSNNPNLMFNDTNKVNKDLMNLANNIDRLSRNSLNRARDQLRGSHNHPRRNSAAHPRFTNQILDSAINGNPVPVPASNQQLEHPPRFLARHPRAPRSQSMNSRPPFSQPRANSTNNTRGRQPNNIYNTLAQNPYPATLFPNQSNQVYSTLPAGGWWSPDPGSHHQTEPRVKNYRNLAVTRPRNVNSAQTLPKVVPILANYVNQQQPGQHPVHVHPQQATQQYPHPNYLNSSVPTVPNQILGWAVGAPQTVPGTPPDPNNSTQILNGLDNSQFDDVLFSTIEDFERQQRINLERQNQIFGASRDIYSDIATLLLPKKVDKWYKEKNQVMADFDQIVLKNQARVSEDIDQFLKDMILVMEEVKNVIFQQIQGFSLSFKDRFKTFDNKIEDFLRTSIQLITSSEPMQHYQTRISNLKSQSEIDPISKEIGIFRNKRDKAIQIEQLFTKIKRKFDKSGVQELRASLEETVNLAANGVYLTPKADQFYKDHAQGFTESILGDQRLESGSLVRAMIVPVYDSEIGLPQSQRHPETPLEPKKATHSPSTPTNPKSQNQPKPKRTIQELQGGGISKHQRVHHNNPHPEGYPKNLGPISRPLLPGKPSKAQISLNNREVILKTNPTRPKLTKIKSISLPNQSQTPRTSQLTHPPGVTTMRAIDTRNLAIAFQNGIVEIYDIQEKQSTPKRRYQLSSAVLCIEPDPVPLQTGQLHPGSTTQFLYCGLDSKTSSIACINLSDYKQRISYIKTSHGATTDLVHLSRSRLYSSTERGVISLWDLQLVGLEGVDHPIFQDMDAHGVDCRINSICLMDNRSLFLSAGDDCRIVVFDVFPNGVLSRRHELKDYYAAQVIDGFVDNKNFVLAVGRDGLIKIWNVRQKK